MTKWWASLILCILILSGSSVWGQSLKLKYEGQDGFWFPRDMALEILADVKTNKLLKLEVEELKLQLDTRLERIEQWKEALHQSEVVEERFRAAMELAFTERDEAEAKLEVWYRHPAFLITVGAVGTILLEIAAVKVLQAAGD